MLRQILKNEKGITGLETAIILIAFVVVAAVFAYTTLSAGLFSTQKSQEAIYSGLKEAQSTLELRGGVIATANNSGDDGTIKQVSFIVSNVLGGEPIDFTSPAARSDNNGTANATTSSNKVVINLEQLIFIKQVVGVVCIQLGHCPVYGGENLLDENELFQIEVDLSCVSANATEEEQPGAYHTFQLEVKPPIGAILVIERTIPARVDRIVNLY